MKLDQATDNNMDGIQEYLQRGAMLTGSKNS